MIFKKISFLCKPLLLLVLFNFSCTAKPKNFNDLLYKLAEIKENERQKELENWLNSYDEFPIVDNSNVFFIFKEKRDLPIYLVGDMNNWEKGKTQLLRIIGTDYYYLEKTFPLNSSFNYNYLVENKLMRDPLNSKTSISSNVNSSFLILPEYEYPTETLTQRNYAYTKLDTIKFRYRKNDWRDIFIFKHHLADYNSPLIFFLSGNKYLHDLRANIIIENLINGQKIKPCIAVFISSKNQKSLFDDEFLAGILDGLLLKIKKDYNLSENKILMGGLLDEGVTAFYAIKNYSDVLDAVFAQSPNFGTDNLRIIKELENTNMSEVSFFYNFGIFEDRDSLNSKVTKFLKGKSAQLETIAYNEGSSNFSLRGHLDDALCNFLGKEH